MKIKMSSQKLIALIFIILMFGSTFAIFLTFGTTESQTIEIPDQRIINYRLNERQRSYLLQRGYTLIEYSYFTGCLECANTKNKLEQITVNSDNQIFLQELVSTESAPSSVNIASLKGQKTLDNPPDEVIESTICEILINKPLWCIISKI